MTGETQVMWSVNTVIKKSKFTFVLGGRNILSTAVSSTVTYNFWCDFNNTGVTITPPAAGYHYWAIEKSNSLSAGEA